MPVRIPSTVQIDLFENNLNLIGILHEVRNKEQSFSNQVFGLLTNEKMRGLKLRVKGSSGNGRKCPERNCFGLFLSLHWLNHSN